MSNNKTTATSRSYGLVGHVYRILTSTETTGGFYTLIEGIIPPEDPGPPLHTHSREDESFYIIEGNFTIIIGEQEVAANPGDYVICPRRIRHTFSNKSKKPGKILVVVTPSGFEKYIEEVGQPLSSETTFVPPPSEEHIQEVIKTAPKYGLIIHI